ncbi:hypothetical protein P4H71_09365 [Paenibacillus kribbensis]|nr:hypothetical protein [Paenibacillus kribbensis]MEC0234534.1 hypothetical protein [Paenibacillus kribbensis]
MAGNRYAGKLLGKHLSRTGQYHLGIITFGLTKKNFSGAEGLKV